MAKYSKRSEYLNQYKMNDNGKYEYRGGFRSVNDNPKGIKKTYTLLWIYNAVIFGLVVGSGCVNAAGMNNTFYVIIPYIAEVAFLFAYLWNCTKLLLQGVKVKEYIYKTCFPRLSPISVGLAVCSAISFICSLVFIITSGFEGQAFKCILYLVFKIIVFCSAFFSSRFIASIKWMEI